MNKTEKANKIAEAKGKTEKVLPGNANSLAQGNILPAAGAGAQLSSHSAVAASATGSVQVGAAPAVVSGDSGILASSMNDMRTRALEHVQELIAGHGVRLVEAKTDSLQVVIKPGAGLQLSLEMRQHGNAIDAQVVVQRGDACHLAGHWPELQQRLESKGIHLAPLGSGDNFAGGAGANGFQHAPRENPDPLEASAFAAFALAGQSLMPAFQSAAALDLRHGWESWA